MHGAREMRGRCTKIGTSQYFFGFLLVSPHWCLFLYLRLRNSFGPCTRQLAVKVLNSLVFGAAGSHPRELEPLFLSLLAML